MAQILFFIRFKAQLRRTRPDTASLLENAFTAAVEKAGGTCGQRRKILFASFDESRTGFLFDMLIFLETMRKSLEETGR